MTFESIITSGESLTLANGALITGVALALGVISALVYMFKSYCSKNFAVTLALLPPIVAMLIIMVNGNLGTGIAVVGVFSLVRFRSQPGNAREILAIMLSMAIGGIRRGCGMRRMADPLLHPVRQHHQERAEDRYPREPRL